MTQIAHVVESKSIRCFRISSLISVAGLIYVTFVNPPTLKESTVENVLFIKILFIYILAEFLFFSWIVVTRIAHLLGIMVFKSGKIPIDPVEKFLSKS